MESDAAAASAVVWDVGGHVHFEADAVTDIVADDAEFAAGEDFFYFETDVAGGGAGFKDVDAGVETVFCGGDEVLDGAFRFGVDDHSEGAVDASATISDGEVVADFISCFEDAVGGNAVDELFVDRDAD